MCSPLVGFLGYKNFMSDFNRDDSPIEPTPDQESPRRKKLSSDELIALFLAFTGIGTILFWTLGQKTSPINLGALGNGETPFMNADGSRSANGNPNSGSANNGTVTGSASIPDGKAEVKPANSLASTSIAAPTEERRRPAAIASDSTESAAPAPTNKPEAPKAEAANPAAKPSISPAAIGTKATEPTPGTVGTVEQPGKPKIFSDVPEDFWAKPAILALSSRGVIGGFEDGTYKPNQPINRGQFAAMIQKAFEKPRIKEAMSFTDIKSGSPMTPAIEEATRTGFMSGYPNKEFKPEQSIPRLEMLSAIATGLSLKPQGDPIQSLAKYSDVAEIPKWAIPKISSAVEAGIVLPNVSQLEPKKVATRADAASYIYQALIKEGKIKP
jgi:S-layer homology domain